MAMSRVSFNNARHQKLTGILEGSSPQNYAVIICHGLTSNMHRNFYPALAKALSADYFVLRFDFTTSGTGESEGEFSYGGYILDVEDIRAAVDFLTHEKKLQVKVIIGHSKGGNDVLLFGATYPHMVPYIVNISGRFHMSGDGSRFTPEQLKNLEDQGYFFWCVKGREFKVTKQAYEERKNLDMSKISCIVADVLTVHGTTDETIPFEDALEIARRIPSHTLIPIEGADHHYTTHAEPLIAAIQAWITKRLGSTQSAAL